MKKTLGILLVLVGLVSIFNMGKTFGRRTSLGNYGRYGINRAYYNNYGTSRHCMKWN